MTPEGAAGGAPRLRGMRRIHAVAGRAGLRRGATSKVIAVADLAGHQTPPGEGVNGHLGPCPVDIGVGPPRNGLVVTARGHAGRDAAAHLEHRDLMAAGAVVDAGDGAARVRVDPARRVVVAVVVGDPASRRLGAAAAYKADQAGEKASEESL